MKTGRSCLVGCVCKMSRDFSIIPLWRVHPRSSVLAEGVRSMKQSVTRRGLMRGQQPVVLCVLYSSLEMMKKQSSVSVWSVYAGRCRAAKKACPSGCPLQQATPPRNSSPATSATACGPLSGPFRQTHGCLQTSTPLLHATYICLRNMT